MKENDTHNSVRSSEKRRPRRKAGFRLTLRDLEILQAVLEYRALTTPQISALFFKTATPSSRCLARLRVLHEGAFLQRLEQPRVLPEGRNPYVYFLDVAGRDLLVHEVGIDPDEIDWKPSDNQIGSSFIDHLLATNDVRVAVTLASARNSWSIQGWIDDHHLRSDQAKDYVTVTGEAGRTQRAAVVPDGYFALSDTVYHYHHFLEIDRATVVGESSKWGRRDWARKVRVYLEYWKSGLYQKRYGAKSFRVLTVTTGDRRLEHLKDVTERAGGRAVFWFTTFDKVTCDAALTEKIWRVASNEGLYSLTW